MSEKSDLTTKKSLFTRFKTSIKKFLSKPGLFSRLIVIFCIAYCVRIVEWGMSQFEISNTEAATLITAGLTLFGGELLLLCLKRIFSKVDNKKISDVEKEIGNVASSTANRMSNLQYSITDSNDGAAG